MSRVDFDVCSDHASFVTDGDSGAVNSKRLQDILVKSKASSLIGVAALTLGLLGGIFARPSTILSHQMMGLGKGDNRTIFLRLLVVFDWKVQDDRLRRAEHNRDTLLTGGATFTLVFYCKSDEATSEIIVDYM